MKLITYRQRGREGPTAGKTAEVLRDPVSGVTKRVFKG
jgi:hypothetical protein